MKNKKTIKLPFAIKWPTFKDIKNGNVKPKVTTTQAIISGTLITWLALSINSGFIDLVFFSGLSKALYGLFGVIAIPAGFVMCLMSLGFTFGKAFVSMQLAALKELQSKLKDYGVTWYNNLNKPKHRLNFIHKFLVSISIITSISLSIISIGDAIRKNQNVIKRVNSDIERIQKYANTTDKSDEEQFANLIKSSSASANAVTKSADQAAKIWPIIEEYRQEMADFPVARDSKDPIEWNGEEIIPDEYWDTRNAKVIKDVAVYRSLTLNQIRTIKDETALATTIKAEIEAQAKNTSSEELASLSQKTTDAAINEIKNLEGRYTWPEGYLDENKAGQVVEFDPNNISGSISTLGDIKAAYENDNGDVGDSAKMFMLIGPSIEKLFEKKYDSLEDASQASVSTSSFGATEIMMMLLIMLFGFAQEYLIAIFTPEAIIDRKLLSRFKKDLGKFDKNDFLLDIYEDYLGIGIINQKDYDAKARKCVELSELTKADAYIKYSRKTREKEAESFNLAVDKAIQSKQEAYDKQIASLTQALEEERSKEPIVKEVPVEKELIKEIPVEVIKEVPVEKEVIKEVPVEVPVEKEVIKEVPVDVIKEVPVEKEVIKEVPVEVEVPVEKELVKIVEVPAKVNKQLPVRPKVKKPEGYSQAVENAIADLKSEFGDLI